MDEPFSSLCSCSSDAVRLEILRVSALVSQTLHQLVQKRLSFIKGLRAHPLIAAMRAVVVALDEEPLHAVRGNTCCTQILAVRRAGRHLRDYDYAWPHRIGDPVDRLQYVLSHRGRGGKLHLTHRP